MAHHARRALRDIGARGGGRKIGTAGSWWLALAVVCAVGLLVIGALAVFSRPHRPDPMAAGRRPGTPGPEASTAHPAASLSPSPPRASLIGSAPPAPTRVPSPRPAPSPRPPAQPSPSPTAQNSPPQYLTLDPAGGAGTLTPTWASSACTGNLGSAQVSEYTLAGTFISTVSNVVATVTSTFSGQLLGSVGALLSVGGVSASNPGTLQWAVGCYSGAGGTGAQQLAGSLYVTLSADGSYSTSTAPPG